MDTPTAKGIMFQVCCGRLTRIWYSNFASALNCGSSQCRLLASKISPSKESIEFVVRVQTSLSAQFGRRHLYKNFWFGVGDNLRLPTILYGDYIPKSDSGDSTSTCMMRVLEVLARRSIARRSIARRSTARRSITRRSINPFSDPIRSEVNPERLAKVMSEKDSS